VGLRRLARQFSADRRNDRGCREHRRRLLAARWLGHGLLPRRDHPAMKISTGLRGSLKRQRSLPSSCVAATSHCRLKINSSTFVKGELDVSFALLDKDEAGVVIAGGPWRPWSEAGTVHPQLGRIGSVRCAILDPNAQIEIKRMMPIWVPGRPRRQKDIDDIVRLESELRNSGNARGRSAARPAAQREHAPAWRAEAAPDTRGRLGNDPVERSRRRSASGDRSAARAECKRRR
jgi:hypothetical protein